jgi:hypothetical protein
MESGHHGRVLAQKTRQSTGQISHLSAQTELDLLSTRATVCSQIRAASEYSICDQCIGFLNKGSTVILQIFSLALIM